MGKFGLTEERYKQMMDCYDGDEESVQYIVEDWGAELCNKGYSVFNYDGTGMLEIEAINDVGCYTDDEATEQAMRDGVKIIPIDELPEDFEYKYLGWIDTMENRKRIKEHCEKMNGY